MLITDNPTVNSILQNSSAIDIQRIYQLSAEQARTLSSVNTGAALQYILLCLKDNPSTEIQNILADTLRITNNTLNNKEKYI